MKCDIVHEENTFSPITLTIVLESKSDLATMWHYMNQADASLTKTAAMSHYATNPSVSSQIWGKLDALVRKLGMRAKAD